MPISLNNPLIFAAYCAGALKEPAVIHRIIFSASESIFGNSSFPRSRTCSGRPVDAPRRSNISSVRKYWFQRPRAVCRVAESAKITFARFTERSISSETPRDSSSSARNPRERKSRKNISCLSAFIAARIVPVAESRCQRASATTPTHIGKPRTNSRSCKSNCAKAALTFSDAMLRSIVACRKLGCGLSDF
jgi:hypothetical protein